MFFEKIYIRQHKYMSCPAVMSGSDIDGRARTTCGWVTDIRRTDGIEGDERQSPVIKQPAVGCFAMKRTVPTLLPSSHRFKQWGRLAEILGEVKFLWRLPDRQTVYAAALASGSSAE
ncbi:MULTISPECIES: hypothetical protein [Caproicibacterium]|uniref:Uncharacterized protein n=1 Tax=Caproicibacterium argilliputei TaxID=3030016 RepID=A0AA97D5U9_9FIRM|nr:hypothetical protein [Caproicibacterium argilliputei]WOC31145.1 hypothetical protein PXC00_07875 [Caproicibacterium argilliputei]